MAASGVRLWPGCYRNDCSGWGISKALDGVTSGLNSLAHTSMGVGPYMQIDLGSDDGSQVIGVELVARTGCCLVQGQNVTVWLSSTTDFAATGTVVDSGIMFDGPGAKVTSVFSSVPAGSRYLTVQRATSGRVYFHLQEITPLRSGELQAYLRCSHMRSLRKCMHACMHVHVCFSRSACLRPRIRRFLAHDGAALPWILHTFAIASVAKQ